MDISLEITEEVFSLEIDPDDGTALEISEDAEIFLLESAEQGLQGRDGGDATLVTKTAVQALGGHRIVYQVNQAFVDYADNTNNLCRELILGITTGAVSSGNPVVVRVSGEITEPSWNWTAGNLVFLTTNGQLSQTLPVSGFLQVIGVALSATILKIDIRQPIILGA